MGDEMNIHIAQSIKARNELKRIANVKLQIIGAKDSNPIIGCKQDSLSGAYMLTQQDVKLKGSLVANLLCDTSSDTKFEIQMDKYYTGHEVFSHIIPKGINSVKMSGGKKTFEIVDGQLTIGKLDKSSLSTTKNSIIHYIWDKHGPDKTRRFIDDTQRLILNYLMKSGLTMGYADCVSSDKVSKMVNKMINDKILEYNVLLTQYENDTEQLDHAMIETLLLEELNAFGSNISKILDDTLQPNNNLRITIKSGAKGSSMNLQHTMGCIGQKAVEGTRIKKKVENRTLPIFHRDDDTPEARGFIKNSFSTGVDSYEFFYDAMAGREGLIDTAIKSVTWETPIVIMVNNIMIYTEIGKWIDELLLNNKDKIEHYEEKQMELLEVENIYIPTTDYNGNVSWGQVSAVTRHDPTLELYKITTESGRSVIVTDSKSLLIWNKELEEFREVLTKEIKIGDYVPVTLNLPHPHILKYDMFSNLDVNMLLLPKNTIAEQLINYISYNGIYNKDNIVINTNNDKEANILSMLFSRIKVFCQLRNNQVIIKLDWLSEVKYDNQLNDIIMDKIIDIKLIDISKHKKVYDLTIPSTFNFGLANGLQVRDTAKTGYIQRQLIKGLEDISVKYDNTVRNSKNVIIQYIYGENGIEQSSQSEIAISLVDMNNEKIDNVFGFTKSEIKKLTDKLKIKSKELESFNDKYIKRIKGYRDNLRIIQARANNNFKIIEEKYMLPVNLVRLTHDYNNHKEKLDLNPIDIYDTLEDLLNGLETRLIAGLKKSNKYLLSDDRSLKYLFEIALHNYICPKKCIFEYGLSKEQFNNLINDIKLNFIKAMVQPGEMIGVIAAQSIGEPTSQLTLNTKHAAGVASKTTATRGVPRIEELLHFSKDIKTPQMVVYFNSDICEDRQKINKIASYFKYLSIKELIETAAIYYNYNGNDELSKMLKDDNVQMPFFINNQKEDLASLPFVFRLKLDMEKMHDKETSILDIKTKFIVYWQKNFTNFKNMKKNEKDIFSKITRCAILSNNELIHIRFNMTSFNYTLLTDFLKIVLEQITLKGLDNIEGLDITHERKLIFNENTGDSIDIKEYIVYTSGINFIKLKYLKGIDMSRTYCNDINTIYKMYGIEAARQILLNEFMTTFIASGSRINHNHMSVLVDMMTHNGVITSIDRHGLGKLDTDPLSKASFEKTMDHFINASVFNEKDSMKSVSARVMMGKVILGGTGAFDLLLDTNKLVNSEYIKDESGGRITFTPLEEDGLIKDIIKYGIQKIDFFVPIK